MSYCDGIISKGIAAVSCDTPPVKGFERRAIIINRADIDFSGVTFSEGAKNVITALPLKSSKKGYAIEQNGAQPYSGSTASAEIGTYRNGVNKLVQFAILNNDAELAENVEDGLLNGEFVVILEYKDKGAQNKSAFEVRGFHNGLTVTSFEKDPYGDAFAGAIVTLTESNAPMTALYLGESYTAGKAIVDGLV